MVRKAWKVAVAIFDGAILGLLGAGVVGILLFTAARPFVEPFFDTPVGQAFQGLVQQVADRLVQVAGPGVAGLPAEVITMVLVGAILGAVLGGLSELITQGRKV